MDSYYGKMSEKKISSKERINLMETIRECEPWREENPELAKQEDALRDRFNRDNSPYIPSGTQFINWIKSLFS